MRQYAAFAGIVFGQKTRRFFDRLVTGGYASTYDCSHNRARIFHVRYRALYEAIGEPDSRLRRPPAVPRALEHLMLLDAILENPQIVWLSTPDEKVAHLTALTAISPEDLPHVAVATAEDGAERQGRLFPDRLPVGIHPEGRLILVYLVSDPLHEDLRGFLQRHAAMLSRLSAWTLRIVLPPHLGSGADHWRQAAIARRLPIIRMAPALRRTPTATSTSRAIRHGGRYAVGIRYQLDRIRARSSLARRGRRGSLPVHESPLPLSPGQPAPDAIRAAGARHPLRPLRARPLDGQGGAPWV